MKYDERVCKFNMDTGCVELLLRDGRMISIDCTGVEDALDVTMAQRSELDYLIYNDPLGYTDLILNGDPEEYLKNAAGSHGISPSTLTFIIHGIFSGIKLFFLEIRKQPRKQMNRHPASLNIYLQNALPNGRNQNFTVFLRIYAIDIVGSRLNDIPQISQ